MNLKQLSDDTLRTNAKKAAQREQAHTVHLLHHIYEVDRRKLYCDWKFTSLFDWCVRELKLCEGSAHLRITAARLLGELPEISSKIKSGELTLSNISQVNQFCRENHIKDKDEKLRILARIENLSKKEAEKKLFQLSGKEIPAREEKKRISSNQIALTLVISDETFQAVEEVKSLLGKEVSSDELLKLMAQSLKEKLEREKFKQVPPRASKGTKVGGRVLASAVKRAVYARDKKCVNCGSKHRLNFDHRHPYSFGGDNSIENIRLLCFNCNQRAWKTSSG